MRINFPCTPEIADFMNDVAAHMTLMFDISKDEAVGRINQYWEGDSFLDGAGRIILHETAEYWAQRVYYKPGTMWWLADERLEPRPYP